MRGAENATTKLARLPDVCENPPEVFENVSRDVSTPRSSAESPSPTPAAECDSMAWIQSECSPTKMIDDYMLLNFDVDGSTMQLDLNHLEQLEHLGPDFTHLPMSMVDPFLSPAQSTAPTSSEYFSLENVDPDLGGQTDSMRATLNDLYFSRVHPIILVHHKRSYFSWAENTIKTDAQEGLQLAMWALAASLSAGTQHMAPDLYARARARLDSWQACHPFQEPPEVERVQTYLLLTIYEVTRIGVQRACMTGSYCFRLVQLLHWHELDAFQQRRATSSNTISGTLESPVSLEEKRRSFWVAFALDRFISMSSGWPLTLNDNVISTRLPCPEAEYQEADMASELAMPFPSDALSAGTVAASSPLTDMVMFSIMSGRILEHSQRFEVEQSTIEGALRGKERHDWLQRTVAAGSDTTLQNYGSGQQSQQLEADPMAIFNKMLAHMNVLSVCHATKSHPISPLEDQTSSLHEASYNAAQEIFRLSRLLAELSYLKVCTSHLVGFGSFLVGSDLGMAANSKIRSTLSHHCLCSSAPTSSAPVHRIWTPRLRARLKKSRTCCLI